MLTIAWDIDDCLNELMRLWFEEKWIPEHPACGLKYPDIKENPPHKLLGVSEEAYLNSLDEFRESLSYRNMPPNPEVKAWFSHNGGSFRHIALSAVPAHAANISAEWLMRHFGAWIRTFHFVPSLREESSSGLYDRSKKDFLRWFGKVDIFIDDSERNIRDSQELGIKGLLFPRPWNSSKLTVKEILGKLQKD